MNESGVGGYPVQRFTWTDVVRADAAVAATIAAQLGVRLAS
ncbi:hypothetical protein BH20ACT2_BH20ACT2_25760 [soil metagenome]